MTWQKFENKGREWEEFYRQRWAYAKAIRSTHGVNCTGSCSWLIYVKDGIIITEMQALDYPIINEEIPPYEPRGCPRGASFSWYEYAPHRIKHPYIRKQLLKLWREELEKTKDPIKAWENIVEDPEKVKLYKENRGKGGFVRISWDEVEELVSAALIYTIKKYGPDRIAGFTPIPAMSMVSYAAGTRFLSLIGGVIMSFYDWYADLPIASPQVWGEQTDVPESADWFNSTYIIDWGTNIPQTRTPDAHFLSEVRYRGTKVVAISPDYAEYVKFADLWLHPKPGTDGALALAMAHVIAKEFHVDRQAKYFTEYLKKYTDAPFLVILEQQNGRVISGRFLRASDIIENVINGEWKLVVYDTLKGRFVIPNGSIGFRWSDEKKWNLKLQDSLTGENIEPALTFLGIEDQRMMISLTRLDEKGFIEREIPVKLVKLANGKQIYVTTVFDLLLANLGVRRGDLKGYPTSYDDDKPYTPAWQEKITGVPRDLVIQVAREFAKNAEDTNGKSMILVGAGVNHWFNSDLIYRAIITILMLIGAIGVNGGGWAHYVGQEKVRPFEGWQTIAFARDWMLATRFQNTTTWIYIHSDQWKYDSLTLDKLTPNNTLYKHPADYIVLAVKRGWTPFYPQFDKNPLNLSPENVIDKISSGEVKFAITDPDNPINFPRIFFIWRANLLFSSGKGSEYILKHLLGTHNSVNNTEDAKDKVTEITWREPTPIGKLDLIVDLNFRMDSSALYSDIVLPAATWYEKYDISSTDMHTFVHPFQPATDPSWEARNDWDIFVNLAKKFSEMASRYLNGKHKDVVYLPLSHDTPDEISQSLIEEELDPPYISAHLASKIIPKRNFGNLIVIERDYTKVYEMMISLGPLIRDKELLYVGIPVNYRKEYEELKEELGEIDDRPDIKEAKKVAEVMLRLSGATNGEVSVKEYKQLEVKTSLNFSDLYEGISEIKIKFDDIIASPKRVIDSPIESGIVKGERTYNSFTFNIEYEVPWRTLSGRQHFYLDHPIIRELGEQLPIYAPPLEYNKVIKDKDTLVLRYLTPHGKWQIHSTFMDNLRMLTLFRGGPIIWLNEEDARSVGIKDNEWVEVFNENGVTVVRAVVSNRIPRGTAIMYHAQERTVYINESRLRGIIGGSHNAVTMVNIKPTWLIGGYAQLSYALNYYGAVGTQRDTIVAVRRWRT
ncbi:nitrate reductase, alpha subunit [Sulfolobus islandicus M.14.25]|uniref:nitrate reductase (quinone) n=1 Tax=Saccharolobus islandicus (strain M.14.25 / Kamchatka \|nr:nitrate reductase subunit alpha [Sulfolobus islandicus]ACP37633.1 nitrate reductase, alpha subunit [Sulfolobus islandicus M.14.25]